MANLIKWFTILVVWNYFPKMRRDFHVMSSRCTPPSEKQRQRQTGLSPLPKLMLYAWSTSHHNMRLPFLSQQNHVFRRNPYLTAKSLMLLMQVVRIWKLTVGLQKWTCRRSHSGLRTQWASRGCLWKGGGTREGGGGTLSPGRSDLRLLSRRRPLSPAGCSANYACIQCSGGYSICKCL